MQATSLNNNTYINGPYVFPLKNGGFAITFSSEIVIDMNVFGMSIVAEIFDSHEQIVRDAIIDECSASDIITCDIAVSISPVGVELNNGSLFFVYGRLTPQPPLVYVIFDNVVSQITK